MKASSMQSQGWPKEVSELKIQSSIDGTHQPTLCYAPPASTYHDRYRPLLVALHTWSTDYTQTGGQVVFADWCIRHGWYLLHPNFRGPNTNPNACGSEAAIQDVVDAVGHLLEREPVDKTRIYIVGVSGGGHMALLLAAKYPSRWAGVSAWAPISDLRIWWKELSNDQRGPAYLRRYARHIEEIVGGKPDASRKEPIKECQLRSPVTHLSPAIAEQVNLDINAGLADGRKGGSVPFSHSLRIYNALLPAKEQLGEEWIKDFYQNSRCPTSYGGPSRTDILYEEREIQYRATYKCSRVTIFEGGHEILHTAALNWLACQRLGTPAIFDVSHDRIDWMSIEKEQALSGK